MTTAAKLHNQQRSKELIVNVDESEISRSKWITINCREAVAFQLFLNFNRKGKPHPQNNI